MRAWAYAALPAAFLGLLLVLPLAEFLLHARPDVLGPWERARVGASLRLGAWTALLALAFGLPLAWLLGTRRFPGRRVLRALVTVPFVVPVVVLAAGLLALLGPGGLVERASGWRPPFAGTFGAVLVAHAIYNVPVVVRLVGDAWAALDPRPEAAAATLGAGPAARLLRVTLPRLAPALAAATLLAFLFGATGFGTVLLLGDPVRHATMEVGIYHVGLRLFDLGAAASLALLQLAFTALAALAYALLVARGERREAPASEAETLRGLTWRTAPLALLAGAVACALLAPLAAVVVRALLTPDGWGLGAFARIFTGEAAAVATEPWRAARNSLLFAATTVALAVPLGLLAARAAARSRALDVAWTLPFGASAVTVGLGLLLVFPWRVGSWEIDPRTTLWLVVAAHALVAFPFATRALVGAVRARDPGPSDAARTLGASRARRLLAVDLPLLAPALGVAAALAASASLGEFGASLVVQRPAWTTLPVEIWRHLATSRPDPWIVPEAMALGTLLVLADLSFFLLLERARPLGLGGRA